MNDVEVYFLNDSDQAEFEAGSRGFRNDVFVKEGECFYKLNIYDIVRLKQDFENETEEYGYFSIEPNLVIVKEVTRPEIKLTILKLAKQKFFLELKPFDKAEIERYDLRKIE
jgi:hypothetical protein